jgi:hypothetical protein
MCVIIRQITRVKKPVNKVEALQAQADWLRIEIKRLKEKS